MSKGFDVGGQRVRARLGNQVINWGESLFVAGGINNTNAYDYQALARPGVQLKEAVLPAPMLSVASGLGSGVNVEAYYQFRWNKSELPPVGSYWSTTNALGEGRGTMDSPKRTPATAASGAFRCAGSRRTATSPMAST